VYVVVVELFKAGDQVPDIPLLETRGKALKLSPEHISETGSNIGVSFGLTLIVKVPFSAHCPEVGVKVYVVVVELFKAGDQEPVIPLFDVVGKGDKASSSHIVATASNVGISFWFTIMVKFPFSAH
jgi:hypothetical protein